MIWTMSQFCRERSAPTLPMYSRYHNFELKSGCGDFRQHTRLISRMILLGCDKNQRSSGFDMRRYSTPSNFSTFCWPSPRQQYTMTSCDPASRRVISSIIKSTETATPDKYTGGRISLVGAKMNAILSFRFGCRISK